MLCFLLLLLFTVPTLPQEILNESQEQIIHYSSTNDLADPVSELQKRLNRGITRLKFEPTHGYLASLLRELRVPISSQALVFSKTSSQETQTNPRTPRAIYFNDTVSIGWVPGAPVIDLAAVDPHRGPIFFTLAQTNKGPPQFTRSATCLSCHLGSKTLNVPGLLVRSVFTAPDGQPLGRVDGFVNGHNSPLAQRWGGWYVTGTHAGELHLGNAFVTDPDHPEQIDMVPGANLTNLSARCDIERYLSSHSDIVALLVLEHQVRMQNLITMANYETRFALADRYPTGESPTAPSPAAEPSSFRRQRIAIAGEKLLEYMLFRDEAPMKGVVKGTSTFSDEFQKIGPFAAHGRSLRQFNLHDRLFKFPCSFLIYSKSFDALPPQMKQYLWSRLGQILTGADHGPVYAGLPDAQRHDILEILRETKPEFAAWLKSSQ